MTSPSMRPCPNCFASMEIIDASHVYGREVQIDVCLACHLLFFDKNEHRGLSAQSVLALVERFQKEPICHQPSPTHLPICASCGGDQALVHDSTIHGPFRSHRCARCSTMTIKAVEFLRLVGVVEKVPDNELAHSNLLEHPRQCESCGAPAVPPNQACSFCGLPPLRFDRLVLDKLVGSLNQELRRTLFEKDKSGDAQAVVQSDNRGWHHALSQLVNELIS